MPEEHLRMIEAAEFIETSDGVMGSRPVIKGTRITVSAIVGRLASGDTIDMLMAEYPDIPRQAFEAARDCGRSRERKGKHHVA